MQSKILDSEVAAQLLQMLRDARALAYRDAESFDQAAGVLEQVGQVLAGDMRNGLGHYEGPLIAQASKVTRFEKRYVTSLFQTVRTARNDSVHTGAYIRHHVLRLVELLLILEESLTVSCQTVEDLMVRNPTSAELWHNVANVRRVMLTNSFSYLPIQLGCGNWKLISDYLLVRYLGGPERRKLRLGTSIEATINCEHIVPQDCRCVPATTPLHGVREAIETMPVLVTEESESEIRLLGIVTAFDLL